MSWAKKSLTVEFIYRLSLKNGHPNVLYSQNVNFFLYKVIQKSNAIFKNAIMNIIYKYN